MLWWILHALAEKGGRQTNSVMIGDEERAWPLLFKTLSAALPCPYCREHLDEYIRSHPFGLPVDQTTWRVYLSTYVYDLHEAVNARTGKPSFPKEALHTTYKDVRQFKEKLEALQKFLDRAIKMDGVSLLAWRAFLKQLSFLRATIL